MSILQQYRKYLACVTVLDPACGSGNFLYVTLKTLLDLERLAMDEQRRIGKNPRAPTVHPNQMLGLEINEYAAQLARTVLWIGYVQWHQLNGFAYDNRPILRSLPGIEHRDAALDRSEATPVKAQWPAATYIVGNPPFLGVLKMREQMGAERTDEIRNTYQDAIPGAVDLCCYWFEQARQHIANGNTQRAGLLATNAIRYSTNRSVLERIKETGDIFAAYDDLEWKPEEDDKAAVHVSIVCFDDGSETIKTLNQKQSADIDTRLMDDVHLDRAQRLPQNAGICFEGVKRAGRLT